MLIPIKKQFQGDLNQIISKEALENYAKIMNELGISQEAINWMYTGAQVIQDAMDKGFTVHEAIQKAQKLWKKQFESI